MGSFHLVKQLDMIGTNEEIQHGLGSSIRHIMRQGGVSHGLYIGDDRSRKCMARKFYSIGAERQTGLIFQTPRRDKNIRSNITPRGPLTMQGLMQVNTLKTPWGERSEEDCDIG